MATTIKTEPTLALPTGQLVLATLAAVAAAAATWAVTVAVADLGAEHVRAGLAESAVVALGAIIGLLLVRPGKTRPFSVAVVLWMVAFPLQMAVTLGLTLLLYSAAQNKPSGVALLLSFLVASGAVLVGQTWVCVTHLKRMTGESAVSLSRSHQA